MASDGSICGSRYSHAWVLDSILPGGPVITGHALDEFHDASTARIEGLGHLACLYIYPALIRWFRLSHNGITASTIQAYIDNKAVISRLSNPSFKNLKRALQADFDITHETLQVLASLPSTIQQEHVKSHKYDNPGPNTYVPYPNRLNKLCDEDCTTAYQRPPCLTPPPTLSYPSTTCFLIVGG
jgi:hypothetical protein